MKFRAAVTAVSATLLIAACGQSPAAGPLAPKGGELTALARQASRAPALPMENFTQVDADLYRGGVPTDADMAGLVKLGIKTDIDLQSDTSSNERDVVAHEREVAKRLGLKFVNLPLPFGVEPPKAMLDTLMATLSDPKNLPAYIHCRHGRDRTGTMVAVYRMRHDGYSGEKALDEMKTFGFKVKDYPYFANFVLHYKADRQMAAL